MMAALGWTFIMQYNLVVRSYSLTLVEATMMSEVGALAIKGG